MDGNTHGKRRAWAIIQGLCMYPSSVKHQN